MSAATSTSCSSPGPPSTATKLSKEEFALVKEQEEKKEKDKKEKAEDKAPRASRRASTPGGEQRKATRQSEVTIDWDNLTDRGARLTIHTSPAGDWVLSKDGEKLFYLTRFEKGNDLWVTELRTHEARSLAKLGADAASMELSPDGKFIFVLADGKPQKVDAESGDAKPHQDDRRDGARRPPTSGATSSTTPGGSSRRSSTSRICTASTGTSTATPTGNSCRSSTTTTTSPRC